MAKLQCARLTKFIMPSVTDRPTDRRNSSIPYANPSNRTPMTGASMRSDDRPASVSGDADSFLHASFHRILDVLDLVELDVAQLAADLLHPPDIDGLDDVAGLGVDRNRATRTLPRH